MAYLREPCVFAREQFTFHRPICETDNDAQRTREIPERIQDFSSLHHIVIARESTREASHSATFRKQPPAADIS